MAALVLAALLWALRHAGTALVVARDVGPPDAIVMLASHEWERLPAAAAAARQYPSSVVLLTVPDVVKKWNCYLCTERPAQLEREGIPRDRIVELPNRVGNTYGEAAATRAYVEAHGVRRVLVVTSPYHTRRALAAFRHALAASGVTVGVLPAAMTSPASPEAWWAQAYDRAYVVYEWSALAYYSLKYRRGFASMAFG